MPGRSLCLASGSTALALVEERCLCFADLLVVAENFDVRRRQQENLAGDALDAAVESEDQTGGKIDEALGICLAHVRDVHDHRDAIPETLADDLGVIVGAGMDSGDLPQTGGVFAAGRRTLDRCHGCAVFLFGDRGDFTNYFTYRCWGAALFTI